MSTQWLLISALLLVSVIPAVQQSDAQRTEVHLGLLTPKTGALESLGQGWEDSFRLAIQNLNDLQTTYSFIGDTYDTRTDSTGAEAGMRYLISLGVSGVVGPSASSLSSAVIPIATEAGIPVISYASSAVYLDDEDTGDFFFRMVPPDPEQGRFLAELMNQDRVNSTTFLYIDYANIGPDVLAEFAPKFGGVIVQNITVHDNLNFTQVIGDALAAGAESIVLLTFDYIGSQFFAALDSLNSTVPVYGINFLKSHALFQYPSFRGTRGVDIELWTDPLFNSTFYSTYGYPTSDIIFIPEVYDATMILGKAVIQAQSSRGCVVADNIRTVGYRYPGVSGNITFDALGNPINKPYLFWEASANYTFNVTDRISTAVPDSYDPNGFPTHCSSPTSSDTGTVSTSTVTTTVTSTMTTPVNTTMNTSVTTTVNTTNTSSTDGSEVPPPSLPLPLDPVSAIVGIAVPVLLLRRRKQE